MRAALAGEATVARSQHYYLDITHPLANKGAALAEMAKLHAVPVAEIAVIGDGGNDVAMFERSGLSIAMGNASSGGAGARRFRDRQQWRGGLRQGDRAVHPRRRRSERLIGRAEQELAHDRSPTASHPKISLVLADVDGTLVTAEKVLTPRAGRP